MCRENNSNNAGDQINPCSYGMLVIRIKSEFLCNHPIPEHEIYGISDVVCDLAMLKPGEPFLLLMRFCFFC